MLSDASGRAFISARFFGRALKVKVSVRGVVSTSPGVPSRFAPGSFADEPPLFVPLVFVPPVFVPLLGLSVPSSSFEHDVRLSDSKANAIKKNFLIIVNSFLVIMLSM